jgi:single-strand DNA-binding protein
MSLNKIHIIGNVGKDPESHSISMASSVTKFNVGVSTKRKGEDHTQWFTCKAFNNVGMYAMDHLQKGTKVFVEGAMQSNKYEDKHYWDLIVHKVLILDGKKATNDNHQ